MIFIVGDVHGNFDEFWYSVRESIQVYGVPDKIIQIGDFGYFTKEMLHWENKLDIPVYFIDGNHENFRELPSTSGNEIVEVRPNLFYIPRGMVMEIDGKMFAFCGGGESIDKMMRKEHVSWFREEQVSEDDIQRTLVNSMDKKIDYLITHVPPISMINTHFPGLDRKWWGLPDTWKDISAMRIQLLWDNMDNPKIISGHMHKSIKGENYQLLDCGEVLMV